MIIGGYIVPTIIYQAPSGTDVYAHMFNTQRMAESLSFDQFYEKSFWEESLNFDYPFGLWFFGSIIMKMTGLDIFSIIYILPVILMMIFFFVYYIYANEMLKSPIKSLFSLLFLISMPIVAIGVLNYSTSKFVSFIIVAILIIHIFRFNIKNYVLSLALIFILAFSHTGTYMFLLFFAIAYFLIYALVCRKFEIGMYLLVTSLLFIYVFTVQMFPFIQPQYIDKGRMVLQIGDRFTEIFGLPIFSEWANIFYENVFISNNYIYAVFWSSLIFTLGILILSLINTSLVKKKWVHAVGIFSNISHSILSTPFWIGPVHTVFSIVGFFKLDGKGKCIFVALIISSLMPGAFQSSEGTGSLREIYYLFLIIPVTASLGLWEIVPKLEKFSSGALKKSMCTAVYLIFLIPLISAPIIGSFYFQPDIRGNINEMDNLRWLGTVGNSNEGVAPFAYNERIDFYANKKTPSFYQGTEMKGYLIDLNSVYTLSNSWKAMDNLYSYNINYIIVSNRILKGFDINQNQIRIDDNSRLDKIFSSNNNFSFYKYSYQENTHEIMQIRNAIEYIEPQNTLNDVGSSYLFENNFYKVRVDKYSPKIQYIGTITENFLDEGDILDYIKLSWTYSDESRQNDFLLEDIQYDTIFLDENKIQYSGILKDGQGDENWATIIVTYIFYEKAIQREIKIINDRYYTPIDSNLKIYFTSSIFAPISEFYIYDPSNSILNRRIYPSQDTITLRDRKFNSIFLPRGKSGIRLTYSDTIPYPIKLFYRGSTIYDYAEVKIPLDYYLVPSESMEIVQYISIGDIDTTFRNIESYKNIKILNYPYGINPVIIGSLLPGTPLNSMNSSELNGINSSINEFEEIIIGDDVANMNVFANRQYDDYQQQQGKLSQLDTKFNGILFTNLKFNLDTIKVLTATSLNYIVGFPVPPPEEGFYEEGVRNPKFAYLNGNKTNILIFPASLPTSAPLRSKYAIDDLVAEWRATLNSAYKNEGVVVFLWDKNDISASSSQGEINNLLLYAKDNGMQFTTLESLSDYQHVIKDIYLEVIHDNDYTAITIKNPNNFKVDRFTIKIDLPVITDEESYIVHNGTILRSIRNGNSLTLYILSELMNFQEKILVIEPKNPKRILGVDFSQLYQGWNEFQVRDEDGIGVPEVIVQVNERTYLSDENGNVRLYLRRGSYNVTLEKPGYKTRTIFIKTKGKFFKYFNI